MSSRDYTRHTVTTAAPPGARIGDEYFNPGTNILYKVLAINGTTTLSNQVAMLSSTGSLTISSNTESASTATGALTVAGGMGVAGNVYVGGNLYMASANVGATTLSPRLGWTDNYFYRHQLYNGAYYQGNFLSIQSGVFFIESSALLAVRGSIYNDSGDKRVLINNASQLSVANTLPSTSTTTGALLVAGGVGIAGNLWAGGNSIVFSGSSPTLTFSAANPTISASSYINFPGGAYFSNGVVYTENGIRARGGIINDTGTKILTIGSESQLSVANTMSSTSTTTGALLVAGGIGVAGQGVFGGNLVVGNNANSRANLLVFGGNLNAGVGSSIPLAEFHTTNANSSYLRIINNRHAQGADWTSANTRIQQRIDVTDQGYIEFNPIGATFGVAIGAGTTEVIRFVQSGNVVINATTTSTSTTTGALVVKGGAGIAGQATVGNIVTTNGVFWANGTVYGSSSATFGNAAVAAFLGNLGANSVSTTGNITANGIIATNGLFFNSNVISANTVIAAGQNAFSVGPITQANNIVVTQAAGTRWVIV